MLTLSLDPEYSYVIFTFILSIFVLLYLGFKVGAARKKHNVPYPTMYDNEKPVFNCVQRGHQNFLESYPYVLVLLFVGGLQYPLGAAIAGVVHLLGRIIYAELYATGDPSKRTGGAILIFPSLLYLIYLTGAFGYRLLSN